MFKFDLSKAISEVISFVNDRGKRVPCEEAVIHLASQGFVLAADNEGDLDVDAAASILKSLVSMSTELNVKPGRVGGIGLVSWERKTDKPVQATTALRRSLVEAGLEPQAANAAVRSYMTDLLAKKTSNLDVSDIISKYAV